MPRIPSTLARRAIEGLHGMFCRTAYDGVTVYFGHVRDGDVTKEVRFENKVRKGLTLKY